ncbi:calcium-binding protein, partial [Corallococcus praedator]
FGGIGDDSLGGGAGDDEIVGSRGRDLMVGDAGNDRFVFLSSLDMGRDGARDVIGDFASGLDDIDLRALDLTDLGAAAFTGAGREARFSAALSRLLIDMDGDRVAEREVGLTGVTALDGDDLILV